MSKKIVLAYLAFAVVPIFFGLIIGDRSQKCLKYQQFVLTVGAYFISELPFWNGLSILKVVVSNPNISSPHAQAIFMIEIPYMLYGCYLSVSGKTLFYKTSSDERDCLTIIGTFAIIEIILNFYILGSFWMMSIPYFADVVMITPEKKRLFARILSITLTAIITLSASISITQNEILPYCFEPILTWILISGSNLIVFFWIFFELISWSEIPFTAGQNMIFNVFMSFIYLPLNVKWLWNGLGLISSTFCTELTNSLFLFVLVYGWVIFFLIFCMVIFSYLILRNQAASHHLFRPLCAILQI